VFLKEFSEGGLVGEGHLFRDLLDGKFRVTQKSGGYGSPHGGDDVSYGAAGLFLNDKRKVLL
jgi:hypothetical protein